MSPEDGCGCAKIQHEIGVREQFRRGELVVVDPGYAGTSMCQQLDEDGNRRIARTRTIVPILILLSGIGACSDSGPTAPQLDRRTCDHGSDSVRGGSDDFQHGRLHWSEW